jgi:hypothetical protein
MTTIHPKALEFADLYGFSINEEDGTLNLSGSYDTAVVIDLKKIVPGFNIDIDVPYVRSLVPNESIVFFGGSTSNYPKVPIVQCMKKISLDQWDWSNANCPNPIHGADCTSTPIRWFIEDLIGANKELKERRRIKEEQRIQAAKRLEAQLAPLPNKVRECLKTGMTHELKVNAWGQIGGDYQFVLVENDDSGNSEIDKARPMDLPWISLSNGLLVIVPKNDVPEDAKTVTVKCQHLELAWDAHWPQKFATDTQDALENFLNERHAIRLRKPDFFAPDVYDTNCDEPYLVESLLPDEGVSLFVGDWESGKTILLVDLAAHIASGLPWLNHSVASRPVIYYALEAGRDVSKRFCATNEQLELVENALLGTGTIPVRVENIIPQDYEEWREEIRRLDQEICDRVKLRCEDQGLEPPEDYLGVSPPVIIVDTLRQACSHKSRGPEVEEFFSKVDQLVRDGAASHVIIAHHTTKTGDAYAGDDFLVSDSTSLYYVRRPNRDKPFFRLICDRVKGLSKPPAKGLLFKVVEIGKQTTVVLSGEANANPKLLEIAKDLPARIPTDDLREHLAPHLTGETDGARYKSFQRLRDKLLESGLVVPEDGHYLRST